MEPHLNELKHHVKCLVWEQLFKKNVVFNLIAFNSDLADWQSTGPIVPDETACHDAVAWIEQLEAYGGTATGEAVCRALHHLNLVDSKTGVCPGVRHPPWMSQSEGGAKNGEVSKGIYLFTDGKPDASCNSVLQSIRDAWALNAQMERERREKNCSLAEKPLASGAQRSKRNRKRAVNVCDGPLIHTISFTQDEYVFFRAGTAINFLRKLARMTGGRYHPVLTEAMCNHVQQRARRIDYSLPSPTDESADQKLTPSHDTDASDLLSSTGGDDLDGLIKEINRTVEAIGKIHYFQHVYKETKACHRAQQTESEKRS
ncbi:unnamed protein product [Echinostoma caproni]|uniref:VWFA domain-containing protein n=1 Tax=Echinostoma caproni TaxID=27848 RepID=A0A183AR38_9TREM|nr:unnamed protein product [Echinostoma caproni]